MAEAPPAPAAASAPQRLFLVAGEPSGDALGGALMAGLARLAPGTRFDGIGGEAMAAQGLASRFPMSELTVMGLLEVLPRYRALRRRIAETAAAVAATAPDALITIDAPDFGLRVARAARRLRPGLPVIHYVAPSVWAWRPGRARHMAEVVDHVLALLPFEPPYMEAAGMSCDFVGHPAAAAAPRAGAPEAATFRAARGLEGRPLALILPGSRAGEIARLGPRFLAALDLARARRPDLAAVIPTVPTAEAQVRALAAGRGVEVIVAPDAHRAAFAAADAALAASGTVSLDLAANAVPMVIGYDFAPLTRAILSRLIRTETVTLVNLVSETRAVPEFLGRACQPAPLAAALLALLEDPPARAAQLAAMARTMQRLGAGGPDPGTRAAASVLGYLERRAAIQPPPSTRVPPGA